MKSAIVEQLGQAEILLPSLIREGLDANDRVKARLSLLQAAARHARSPSGQPFDLKDECRAAGLDAVAMEALVNSAAVLADDGMTAPGLGGLGRAIRDDIEAMARPVQAAEPAAGEAAHGRLSALLSAIPLGASDTMALAEVAQLTSLSKDGRDSLHRLVMDLHKDLNRLSAAHAEELLAGAHVHGLLAEDRPLIEGFMRGLESTRMLKFDHPGLTTTAGRSGGRLIIQNDIGETDAHVVVITVEAADVTVTYTDVHLARAKFFIGLVGDASIQWSGLDSTSAAGLNEGKAFHLVTGRGRTTDEAQRCAVLSSLGAALVFLIDWNKARKVLRTLVPKPDAVGILEWAARQQIGHRGFLELGGSEFVASAVRGVAGSRIGFGERLDGALGRAQALGFLKTILRISTETLLQGRSARAARDRVEADLVQRLQRVDAEFLAIVARQAGLARDIASALAQFVGELQAGRPFDQAALAAKARRIEEKADRMAVDARGRIARLDADRVIEQLVNRIEDAIDELEQAAFIASLVPRPLPPPLLEPLAALCAAAVDAAEAAAVGATAAAEVPEGHRLDAEDALAAAARLFDVEHAADTAERSVTATVLQGDVDLRTALSTLDLARAIERATDRFASFGHLLRERVLAELSK